MSELAKSVQSSPMQYEWGNSGWGAEGTCSDPLWVGPPSILKLHMQE